MGEPRSGELDGIIGYFVSGLCRIYSPQGQESYLRERRSVLEGAEDVFLGNCLNGELERLFELSCKYFEMFLEKVNRSPFSKTYEPPEEGERKVISRATRMAFSRLRRKC